LGKFLKQGVMEDGADWQEAGEGTPQGGVISPLLANVYLDPLDWQMSGGGFEMVRYADDMVVMCRSREEAVAALAVLRDWMAEAGLTLHPDKTRVVDLTEAGSYFDFLGYRFMRSSKGGLLRLVRPKSVQKLRDSIRPRTRRVDGRRMKAVVTSLNRTLRGWYEYFKHAHATEMESTDGWVRGRLRSILKNRSGRSGRAGGDDHHRWPNRYFAGLGLYCLLEARAKELASLRNGVNC
jgi:RNA-directed DNA polymerase